MANNTRPQFYHHVFEYQENTQKLSPVQGEVRQDKRADSTARLRSAQPARSDLPPRAHPLNTKMPRTHTATVEGGRTVQLPIWTSPLVKAEVQRRAKREGISASAVGDRLLRKGLQADLDMQYGALLIPVFENILYRRMSVRDNRLAILLVRNYLASEQTRSLVTNLLGRHPDITPDALNDILDNSFKEAKKKLIRRSPDLEELIREVKSWVISEEKAQQKNRPTGKGEKL
jgi:hypothetical protein